MIINYGIMRKEVNRLFSYDLTQVEHDYRGWIEKFRAEVPRVFSVESAARLDQFADGLIRKQGAGFDIAYEIKACLSESELYSFSEKDAALLNVLAGAVKPFKGFLVIYRAFNEWVAYSSELAANGSKEEQYQWMKCARYVVEQICECIMVFHNLGHSSYDDIVLQWIRLRGSRKWLARPEFSNCTNLEYKEFAFFVSMGVQKFIDHDTHNPVISCSYVTNEHPWFYDQCDPGPIGWVFDFNAEDIVCMAPMDASVCYSLDRDESLRSSFSMGIDTGCGCTIFASAHGLQALIPPKEMEMFPNHNEVVLKGETRPVGVLVFAKEYNESSGVRATVCALSYLRKIPIFVYDELRNVVIVLGYDADRSLSPVV